MPVLETIAAVATIVGVFQTAAGLYHQWKARIEAADRARNETRVIARDRDTQNSLALGSQQIQEEYNRAFARLGVRFAIGDDAGRAELQSEVIKLQQTVIALLQDARASSRGSLNISNLLLASEGRRLATTTALTNQYQRMVVAGPISVHKIGDGRSDYFAFASNLHVEQMASRCPSSLFKGRAILKGFRWQVNERGFANIVEAPDEQVEGLVFTVDYNDQLKLDRYEGVRKGFYECKTLHVQLKECVDGPWKTSYVARQLESGRTPTGSTRSTRIDVLVYVSSTYITDGKIRAEYAERLKLGMDDGVALGMSKQYVRRYLEPHISKRKTRSARRQATQSTTTGTAGLAAVLAGSRYSMW